jgi:hypothetical protein
VKERSESAELLLEKSAWSNVEKSASVVMLGTRKMSMALICTCRNVLGFVGRALDNAAYRLRGIQYIIPGNSTYVTAAVAWPDLKSVVRADLGPYLARYTNVPTVAQLNRLVLSPFMILYHFARWTTLLSPS